MVTQDLYRGLACVNTPEDNKTGKFLSYVNYRIHQSVFDSVLRNSVVGLCLLVFSIAALIPSVSADSDAVPLDTH